MDNDVWLAKAVHTVHILCGFYGPTYTVHGCGETVCVTWQNFDIHWRRPGRFNGTQMAEQLRAALKEKS